MGLLDIGEVSRRTGLAASALRFYEDRGLIQSAGRSGIRRQYEASQLDRLAVVILCQKAGFSLAEIGALLDTGGGPGWKQLVSEKLEATRRQAERLTDIANWMEHSLECPSRNVMHCEHFLALLHNVLEARDMSHP